MENGNLHLENTSQDWSQQELEEGWNAYIYGKHDEDGKSFDSNKTWGVATFVVITGLLIWIGFLVVKIISG